MADDKKAAEEKGEGKSKTTLIIIIAVAAVVLIGGGVAAAMMLMGGDAPAPAEQAEAAPPEDKEYLVPLDSFVVNLSDPRGDRFMKATMRVVVSDPNITNQMRDDDLFRTRVRDRTISVLSSKRFQDVSSPLGKESLRRELQREYTQIFPPDTVNEVLFVEFIVQ